MSKRNSVISDKRALSNLEALLKIPLIKRFGVIGVSDMMSRRAVKFKPQSGNRFYSRLFGNVHCDVITKENSKTNNVILYFHLGAFVSGTTDTHREVGELFLLNSNADTVIVVDYKTAPKFKFPSAHNDALEVLNAVRADPEFSHSKIIAAGDSSGGNLALSLALMLKDNNQKQLDGLVLISPWVDFTNSGKSYAENFNSDPMFGYLCTPKDKEFVTLYAENADKTDKYLSPVFHNDYSGLPPIFIQACSNEMLLDDAKTVLNLAASSGVDAKLKLYDNMFHSFQTVTANAETSKKAWLDTGEFINSII
ncbi:MAG: alpha/beta hydrolase [Clostridia bacterium]|nr:alpha/beta hydrolase [Clostridia bacterium]